MIYDNGSPGRIVMGLARSRMAGMRVCLYLCSCVYSAEPQLGQDCKWE